MPKTDFDRLFNQLESLSVGFGPVFREFKMPAMSTYPPHNIVKVSDNEFYIEVALAGFKRDEISIVEDNGTLVISSQKDDDDNRVYQHKGIAHRSFTKSFKIAEYFEVSGAKMEDGILTVSFVKNVPDEDKPKVITIN